ncbi:hypothetical protein B0H10DRAFT_430798 [Mycena sp. CBHHK59/15]|nr:hypothetical protein B0H10DRAFT_430798 [Mycena sp. CBHHK59/15]
MAKSNKRKREESEDEDEDEAFNVEVFTCARVSSSSDKKDGWEYRVKWAGYDSDADTWEPAAGVAGCAGLLERFWAEIGLDDNDYPIGYVVRPSEKWIKKERKRSKAELKKEKEEARKQKERADRRREKEWGKKDKKRKLSLEKEAASVVASSSLPSLSSSASNKSADAKKKGKQKQIVLSDLSDSEDDKPLANLQKRKRSSKDVDSKHAKYSREINKTRAEAHLLVMLLFPQDPKKMNRTSRKRRTRSPRRHVLTTPLLLLDQLHFFPSRRPSRHILPTSLFPPDQLHFSPSRTPAVASCPFRTSRTFFIPVAPLFS